MKIRLFAVIAAAFAFCSIASAQAYFIRAESRNNLRSCAGFGCRVVETVPVGTVLEVVGEYNRWLKISHNGEEMWMANWIDYTRVEPGEPVSSPSASVDLSQSKHPGVIIEGSEDFIAWVEAALDMLEDSAPEWYVYADNGLNKVVEHLDSVGVDVGRKIFYYTRRNPEIDFDRDVVWLAAVLVHEACHVYRDQAGFPYGTVAERFREEVVCQQIQIDALKDIDPQDRHGFEDYLYGLIDDFFSYAYKL